MDTSGIKRIIGRSLNLLVDSQGIPVVPKSFPVSSEKRLCRDYNDLPYPRPGLRGLTRGRTLRYVHMNFSG